MLISETVDLRTRKITTALQNDKKINSIHQDDITMNVYTANNKASKHMKEKLIELKDKIDKSTIILRHLLSK